MCACVAAARFTQNIPHISHLSSASFVYFAQEHVRWLFMCVLKLISYCGTRLDAEFHQNHRLPSSFAAFLCVENILCNVVLRSRASSPSPAEPHRSDVLAESYVDILNSAFLTCFVLSQASRSENAAVGGSTDSEQEVVSRSSLVTWTKSTDFPVRPVSQVDKGTFPRVRSSASCCSQLDNYLVLINQDVLKLPTKVSHGDD